MENSDDDVLRSSPLGSETRYPSDYSPDLLYVLPRAAYRDDQRRFDIAGIHCGVDRWYCYELSWLQPSGTPAVSCAQLVVPASSEFIVESKSLKLYFNSLNFCHFDSADAFADTVRSDLAAALGDAIQFELLDNEALMQVSQRSDEVIQQGLLIDTLEVACSDYLPAPSLLQLAEEGGRVDNAWVYSDLLRTNCPVTGQPDWASVSIQYSGQAICARSLLRYIVSYRSHQGFHEQSIELIYADIWRQCRPDQLLVMGHYTRRGGIDINPQRSSDGVDVDLGRSWRQ